MAQIDSTDSPDYGVGIGLPSTSLRTYLCGETCRRLCLRLSPKITWSTVVRALQVLDEILETYRVVQHGVSMYFGSAQPLNREHLKRL